MKYTKYTWSNRKVQDFVNMQTRSDDFVVQTEYNLQMMDNLQRSPKRMKRFRSAFTTDQVNYLELQFKKFPYIGNAHRKEVATVLKIPERAVKIWFQNRRMKEKKEINKECDEETCNPKSVQFSKHQLNNVTMPSVNDRQPCPLPLLTDEVDKTNCGKMVTNNNTTLNMSAGLLVAHAGDARSFNTTHTPTAFIKPHPTISPIGNNNAKSIDYGLDLCNKLKTEPKSTFVKPIVFQANQDIKPRIDLIPNHKLMEQMVPEDLSSRKDVPVFNQTFLPDANQLSNNPGYISLVPNVPPFYAQPYYSASGVVWNPVNYTTVTGAGSTMPIPVSNNLGPMSTSSGDFMMKKCCSCDCHVKGMMPNNLQLQTPGPQYIITTVQLPNPSGTKF